MAEGPPKLPAINSYSCLDGFKRRLRESLRTGLFQHAEYSSPFLHSKVDGNDYLVHISLLSNHSDTSEIEFEILELELEDNGKIKSFAANVLQYRTFKKKTGAFICIRYNSSIPVEVTASSLCGSRLPTKSIFYYTWTELPDFITSKLCEEGDIEKPFVSNNEAFFEYGTFNDIENGITVNINNYEKKSYWMLEFNTRKEGGLTTGLTDGGLLHWVQDEDEDETLVFYPNVHIERSLYLGSDMFNLALKTGGYKIHKIEKNEKGEIQELAIDFLGEKYNRLRGHGAGSQYYCLKGALRYNSDIPINLIDPYKVD